MSNYKLKQLELKDAGQLLELSEGAEWNHSLEDWRAMLQSGVIFGHRTEIGELVSSAGIFSYGEELASIGMVIVRADVQKQGLGRALMERCLAALARPDMPVTLIATSEGLPLYKKLGFEVIGEIHKFLSEAVYLPDWLSEKQNDCSISALTEDNLEAVIALDRKVSGANRERMLQARFEQASGGVIVRNATGELDGFALKVKQRDLLIIGPVVAPNDETAMRLIYSLTADYAGPTRLDVPGHQIQFLNLLPDCGFRETNISPHMLLHSEKLPGSCEFLFGITTQAFG